MTEVESATAGPGEKRPVGRPRKTPAPVAGPPVVTDPVLAPAGASGNAAVHELLAQREIAVMNGDDDAVAAADAGLAALGVAV